MIEPTQQDRKQAIKDVYEACVPKEERGLRYSANIQDFLDWCGPNARPNSVAAAVQSRAEVIALARRCKELEEALKIILPVLENEQECREHSFGPEPHGEEERYLEEINAAVEAARGALLQKESR